MALRISRANLTSGGVFRVGLVRLFKGLRVRRFVERGLALRVARSVRLEDVVAAFSAPFSAVFSDLVSVLDGVVDVVPSDVTAASVSAAAVFVMADVLVSLPTDGTG